MNITSALADISLNAKHYTYGGVAQLGAQGTQKRTLVKIEYYTHGALAQLG